MAACWLLLLLLMMMMTVVSAQDRPNVIPRQSHVKPHDCLDVKNHWGSTHSDEYSVYLRRTHRRKRVFCDMQTQGGGWTVILQRRDGILNFYRNWTEYRTGFGNFEGDYYIGNDILFFLIRDRRQQLRVELEDWQGNSAIALYDNFRISMERMKYSLSSVGNYSGTAGDSLTYHLGMPFSTKDQDHDSMDQKHCAQIEKGGWWYRGCSKANLNGEYLNGKTKLTSGIIWYTWKGYFYSLKKAVMKVKPF